MSAHMQRKRKSRKGGSHSMLSLLRKELREGNLQSLFGASSCILSSSNSAPDPLLSSFILPMADDFVSIHNQLSTETSSTKKSSDTKKSERYVIAFHSLIIPGFHLWWLFNPSFCDHKRFKPLF